MRILLSIIGILVTCRAGFSQTGGRPRFEVASIRRSAPDDEPFVQAHPGGRLDVSHQTLKTLIALAYRVQSFQVSGGPAWIRSTHFDLTAKASENPGTDRLLLMLQSLLKERFELKVHMETKEAPVYALVTGRIQKMRPAGLQVTTEGSCVKSDVADASEPRVCGAVGMGTNHLEAHEISMARIAEALSRVLDREVIDKTGRSEKFNISLQWTPEESQETGTSYDAVIVPLDTPSIFIAIQEQLGLRLKPEKARVRLLVIDEAEQPSVN